MGRERIGELLAGLGQLSSHDINDILSEQRATRERFGAIAVSLGFCQPEHVWAAWCSQLDGHAPQVDLDEMGVDAQAADHVPRAIALALGAMPVRVCENTLVLAFADPARAAATLPELSRKLRMTIKYVLAPQHQIDHALAAYYPEEAHALH